jgi:hypothetical protein
VIDVYISGSCVHLSRDEGWQLRMRLGDRAPFVRNQLMVIQQGGGGSVRLSTPQERQDVLDALSDHGQSTSILTLGLRSLKAALVDLGDRDSRR